MKPEPLLVVKNLSRSLSAAQDTVDILNGVDFQIGHGESVAIVGESGSGKSTLLGLLAGLDIANSGEVLIDGVDICQLDEDARADIRAKMMGFVFQSFQLMNTYTALENVMLPLELQQGASNSANEIKRKALDMLDRVGLAARASHYPHQLSGGEQQRVALARAFVTKPSLLFADEPTGNLDPNTSELIADLMFELNVEQATTLVLVTHSRALADRCQRRLRLIEGKIVEAQ
ncbi:MAG: putative ABC transport system ATP-binding protein [Saprospiraceae bacterium]|jgi:putative ABC transport system ATP-binding protein